ncbi:MliC family protein [Litchfieldella rifensis]|uniref:MliC family protein n=1 Tax=Litchfieldella rifensis TaxID=762643 RepID=A0ABV7LKM9_9GAMM
MSSAVISPSRFLPLLLGAGLVLAGCATPPSSRPDPKPAVVDSAAATAIARQQGGDTDADEGLDEPAPLMPSTFFAGGAERFVAWRCTPAQDLVSAFPGSELRLWSSHGAYRLAPAVVASGARYVQGDLSFWNKGDEARVESDNGRLECKQDVARQAMTREERPGVMFHGRGNEPGWVINLAHDAPQVTMLLDYGERELELPYRVTEMDNENGRVTLASGREDQPFRLELEARACFDDMSGQPFPVRVMLDIDGQRYRGCGQGIAP